MKRKIVFLSTISAMIIVLASISPSISAKDMEGLQSNETLRIEVNRYSGKKSDTICTEVSYEEAEEIKQILIQLDEAIENNDKEAISHYESVLNDKGIFGNDYQEFYSNDEYSELMEKSKLNKYSSYLGQKNEDNISNYMCYFHATGQGIMFFYIGVKLVEAIMRAIENTSSWIAGLILLLALLPFLVLVMLFTHLIPFRILMPIGVVTMQQGKMSSLGLGGFKRIEVDTEPVSVNLSWFTGITINIPFSEKPFLFVSGIALEVKETET